MSEPTTLDRLLSAARQADDPARRVAEALSDDPLFASWAAGEAVVLLATPTTARPERGGLVVRASGSASEAMRAGLGRIMGPRPVREDDAGPGDRLLMLLSPGGSVPTARPAETLALVLGAPDPDQLQGLLRLDAVVRRLGEDRSVLATVQRVAREERCTPVVLHRHLRGSAASAGRGLARAALAVEGGVAHVSRPACLLLVGELRAGADASLRADAAGEVEASARRALRASAGGGGRIQVGAVTVGAGARPRVFAVAIVS